MKTQAKRRWVAIALRVLQTAATQHVDIGCPFKITMQKGIQAKAETGHALRVIREIRGKSLRRRQVWRPLFVQQPHPARLQPEQPGNLRQHFLQRLMHIDLAVQVARDGIEYRQVAVAPQ